MISVQNLKRLHAPIRSQLVAAVERVIDDGRFVMGPEVDAFERESAAFLGVSHAVSVSNGTVALELALRAAGVQGERVVTTAFSFASTATAILAAGAVPVFVDIDPQTFNIDIDQAIDTLQHTRAKAIVVVHLYGRPCDMDPLLEAAHELGACVIEDAAQAFGATLGERRVGTLGDLGCFSFFPSKNLGALGQGGLVTSNSDELIERIRRLREPVVDGFSAAGATNARLDDLQAAILRTKLPFIDRWNAARHRLALAYAQHLAATEGIVAPRLSDGHIVHQYVVRTPRRDELRAFLQSSGIEARSYYPKTLPEFVGVSCSSQQFPVARRAAHEVLSLPLYPGLTAAEQQQVIAAVRAFAAGCPAPVAGVLDQPQSAQASTDDPSTPVKASIATLGEAARTPIASSALSWSVGMTTAPRKEPTLATSLRSLIDAGWESPRLFAEPGTPLPMDGGQLPLSCRDVVLGAFSNWLLALTELYLRSPRADAFLICQDDVLFSRGLRGYLDRTLWPAPEVGVVSVYCPNHRSEGREFGFHAIDDGWDSWGALAYAFPNPSLRAFLSDPLVINHRHHGPGDGMRNIDSVVGNWCRRTGRPYFVHVPSLAEHIGTTSTIWSRSGTGGRRRAGRFLSDVETALGIGNEADAITDEARAIAAAMVATPCSAEATVEGFRIAGDA